MTLTSHTGLWISAGLKSAIRTFFFTVIFEEILLLSICIQGIFLCVVL